MSRDFYSELLGLPPGARPPDHFALLGLPRLRRDLKRIEKSARHRLDQLDRFHSSRDTEKREACLELMDEIAEARTVLVDAHAFNEYVRSLGMTPDESQSTAGEAVTAHIEQPDRSEPEQWRVAFESVPGESDEDLPERVDGTVAGKRSSKSESRPYPSSDFAARLRQSRKRFGAIDDLANAVAGRGKARQGRDDASPPSRPTPISRTDYGIKSHQRSPINTSAREDRIASLFKILMLAALLLGVALTALLLTAFNNGPTSDVSQIEGWRLQELRERHQQAVRQLMSGEIRDAVSKHDQLIREFRASTTNSAEFRDLYSQIQFDATRAHRAHDTQNGLLFAIRRAGLARLDDDWRSWKSAAQSIESALVDLDSFTNRIPKLRSLGAKADGLRQDLYRRWDDDVRRRHHDSMDGAQRAFNDDDFLGAAEYVSEVRRDLPTARPKADLARYETRLHDLRRQTNDRVIAESQSVFDSFRSNHSFASSRDEAGPFDIGVQNGAVRSLKAGFYGTGGNAHKIIYVIDASGSMIGILPFAIEELKRSISDLNERQEFTVIVFRNRALIEAPPRGLKSATIEMKANVSDWISRDAGHITPYGATDPMSAIVLAMRYKPELMFILSDNITGHGVYEVDRDKLMDMLDKSNKDRKIKINAIQFIYPDGLNTLRDIAKGHGGTYRFVTERDLGLNK